MKLVTFEESGTSTLVPGILTENESGVINLPRANEILGGPGKSNHFSSLLDIIEGGESALDKIRDILRQEVLEGMGWKIYRIWSTDWFKNPQAELKKLDKYIKKLIN